MPTWACNGTNVLNSELFFESIPDEFIDVPLKDWKYQEGSNVVPIILPRTYIAMYNFGFARSHALPMLSEGLMGMIDFKIFIHGNGRKGEYKGGLIVFKSAQHNPRAQSFMDWSKSTMRPTNIPTLHGS
jgi:hypothetical protein